MALTEGPSRQRRKLEVFQEFYENFNFDIEKYLKEIELAHELKLQKQFKQQDEELKQAGSEAQVIITTTEPTPPPPTQPEPKDSTQEEPVRAAEAAGALAVAAPPESRLPSGPVAMLLKEGLANKLDDSLDDELDPGADSRPDEESSGSTTSASGPSTPARSLKSMSTPHRRNKSRLWSTAKKLTMGDKKTVKDPQQDFENLVLQVTALISSPRKRVSSVGGSVKIDRLSALDMDDMDDDVSPGGSLRSLDLLEAPGTENSIMLSSMRSPSQLSLLSKMASPSKRIDNSNNGQKKAEASSMVSVPASVRLSITPNSPIPIPASAEDTAQLNKAANEGSGNVDEIERENKEEMEENLGEWERLLRLTDPDDELKQFCSCWRVAGLDKVTLITRHCPIYIIFIT